MSLNDTYLPGISIDCVIFGFTKGALKVLLLEVKGGIGWALPGGFIKKEETLEHAAQRVLKERTGLEEIFLEQHRVFGDPDRRGQAYMRHMIKLQNLDSADEAWILERFLSIAYFALVDLEKTRPEKDAYSDSIQWLDISQMPKLLMDHGKMVLGSLKKLREGLRYFPIGINLMPEKFTMSELQGLYEAILGKSMDRRNFQRKMLSFGVLEKLDERRTGLAHKSPQLYRFQKENYFRAVESGLGFQF